MLKQQVPITKSTSSYISFDYDPKVKGIIGRDLDSRTYSFSDPMTISDSSTVNSVPKTPVWESYWAYRNHKHLLLKLVNEGQTETLGNMLNNKNNSVNLNDYVYLHGWSLLHHATSKCLDMAQALITHGCNVNTQTESMRSTPLHLAVLGRHSQIVELLLRNKANPNIVDADFCTPLHYSAEMGFVEITQIILNSQAYPINFQLKNNKKMTVVDCCRDERTRKLMVEYCEKYQYPLKQSIDQRRTFNAGDGRILHTRNRCDFVDRLLNERQHNVLHPQTKLYSYSSLQDSQLTLRKIESKVNLDKFKKVFSMAEISLASYKNLLMEGNEEQINKYDVIRKIGAGTFGTVYLICSKSTNRLFAMKKLNKTYITQNRLKQYVYSQRQILKSIKHPFILHAFSFFQDRAYLYMVMNFCAGGDMERQVKLGRFPEPKTRKICCEVVLALEELHAQNYLFRDLKTSNVLLDEDGHIKIADFGLAKQSRLGESCVGTVNYLAPEMLVDTETKPHTAALDWYLFGVFTYELLTGRPPFFNDNPNVMFEAIKREKPKLPMGLSSQCKDFLLGALTKKPEERLGNNGAEEVKRHAWFAGVDWKVVKERGLEMEAPVIDRKELMKTRELGGAVERRWPMGRQVNYFDAWNYEEDGFD